MLTKVIYRDGKSGMEEASAIVGLRKMGKIAAYESLDGWIEVRRRQSLPDYQGPERRVHSLM